jgi:hypothetical protein
MCDEPEASSSWEAVKHVDQHAGPAFLTLVVVMLDLACARTRTWGSDKLNWIS